MSKKDALSIVREAYIDYAKYVNSHRALPSIQDGLKAVQRRILLTCSTLANKSKCAQVVGQCIAKYHPHGDSSVYGALVNLVTNEVPLLNGQGNFGVRGVEISQPAAMRYTSVSLNSLGELFVENKHNAPTFKNDLNHTEPFYLPTPISYCIINGSRGIGVGITSLIPKCDIRSIIRYINDPNNHNILPSTKEGYVSATNSEIEKFNTTGIGTFTYKADIRTEYHQDEQRDVIVITSVPRYIPLVRIFQVLSREIEEQLVFIRDESTDKIRIIVSKNPRIRKITDEELLKKVKRAFTKNITFKCVVDNNGVASLVTPKFIVEQSLRYAETAYKIDIQKSIDNLSDEIIFNEVRSKLTTLLMDPLYSDKKIMKELQLTQTQFDKFTNKSLKLLRGSTPELQKQLNEYKNKLNNIRENVTSIKLNTLKKFI